jgi:hypothetical protein
MSLVQGLSSISKLFDNSLDALGQDLAHLDETAVQSEDEDLYAGLQCGEHPLAA